MLTKIRFLKKERSLIGNTELLGFFLPEFYSLGANLELTAWH